MGGLVGCGEGTGVHRRHPSPHSLPLVTILSAAKSVVKRVSVTSTKSHISIDQSLIYHDCPEIVQDLGRV